METAFAEELCQRRASLGLTQNDLAERTGLSVTYIRTLERGGANPSFSSMFVIAEAFGLSLRELIESLETTQATGRAGPTGKEAARLFEGLPKNVQASVLDLLRCAALESMQQPKKKPRRAPT